MSLNGFNWCPEAAVMLHGGAEISYEKQVEVKAVFLEAFIRFLDIYAQTEIGEGFELDIMKIALHINSPQFENDDLYAIHSIEDAFRLCESLAVFGLPIWRFLRINEWQRQMLEKSYRQRLKAANEWAAKEKLCYSCIWYREEDTSFGFLQSCDRPETGYFKPVRKSAFDPVAAKGCEWLTTLSQIPDLEKINSRFLKSRFMDAIEPARERFKERLGRDPFRIPESLSGEEIIDLAVKYSPLQDLACVCNNKRSKSDRQYEVSKAMLTEGAIRFFESYAKCEIGSSYVANIKEIALWIDDYDFRNQVNCITSYEDVYGFLEDLIVNGDLDVLRFVKRNLEEECSFSTQQQSSVNL